MAIVGNSSLAGFPDAFNIDASYRDITITMIEDGTVDSVSTWLEESFEANTHNLLAIVRDMSGTIIDQSTCQTAVPMAQTLITFQ
jgi:hypothetical protein